MIDVCIGYDPRESVTYKTCVNSIRRHTSGEVRIVKLGSDFAHDLGFDRQDASAATAFSLARFLVPWVPSIGTPSLFCDCDFVFTQGLQQLFSEFDPRYAVQVVKHPTSLWLNAHGSLDAVETKMDGKKNSYYPKKWWSALVLWNPSHRAHDRLTMKELLTRPPGWLHRFEWLLDDEIGELSSTWHWLDGYSADSERPPAGIHFTRGTPELGPEWENTRWASLWREYRDWSPTR